MLCGCLDGSFSDSQDALTSSLTRTLFPRVPRGRSGGGCGNKRSVQNWKLLPLPGPVSGGGMDSPEVTFTLAYLVFAVCFVFTPNEFYSAGLTVQNLLSGWLGSEDAAFVPYHLRRTSATLLCHSLLPLGEPPVCGPEVGA